MVTFSTDSRTARFELPVFPLFAIERLYDVRTNKRSTDLTGRSPTRVESFRTQPIDTRLLASARIRSLPLLREHPVHRITRRTFVGVCHTIVELHRDPRVGVAEELGEGAWRRAGVGVVLGKTLSECLEREGGGHGDLRLFQTELGVP